MKYAPFFIRGVIMKKRITKRVLSLLLACMVGVGAFFGSVEKVHANPLIIGGAAVALLALGASGVIFTTDNSVRDFLEKYNDNALFVAIKEAAEQCQLETTATGVLLYTASKPLIDAVKKFWAAENVEIQAEFGGSIEGGVWKGTAEWECNNDYNKENYNAIPAHDFHAANLGNVTLTYGNASKYDNITSANMSIFTIDPFGTYALDYDGTYYARDLESIYSPCFYKFAEMGVSLSDYVCNHSDGSHCTAENPLRHRNSVHYFFSNNFKKNLVGCQHIKYLVRYIGEDATHYIYERTTHCSNDESNDTYDSTSEVKIAKTVVGLQTPNDIKLDEINKKLDALKEGMLFKAPDVGGVVSDKPGDYVGLTSDDVIYPGTDVPKKCICSDNVINKSCPLHGIGCADCICVGNEYSKECTVHGSLATEGENTGILSNIYEGVKSIARSIADAIEGVGAGIYTAVGEIADFVKDMFKPSDFDLDFDGFKAISLADKFPFCIPFDFYKCISVWSADASNYKLHVNVNTSFWKINHTVDMSPFSIPIKFFRLFCIVLFSYILITRTRSLMKW